MHLFLTQTQDVKTQNNVHYALAVAVFFLIYTKVSW